MLAAVPTKDGRSHFLALSAVLVTNSSMLMAFVKFVEAGLGGICVFGIGNDDDDVNEGGVGDVGVVALVPVPVPVEVTHPL
jgi:hypothetical protein